MEMDIKDNLGANPEDLEIFTIYDYSSPPPIDDAGMDVDNMYFVEYFDSLVAEPENDFDKFYTIMADESLATNESEDPDHAQGTTKNTPDISMNPLTSEDLPHETAELFDLSVPLHVLTLSVQEGNPHIKMEEAVWICGICDKPTSVSLKDCVWCTTPRGGEPENIGIAK
jgi:hypothetical protein